MKIGPVELPNVGNALGILVIVFAAAYVGRAILPASKFNGFNYTATS